MLNNCASFLFPITSNSKSLEGQGDTLNQEIMVANKGRYNIIFASEDHCLGVDLDRRPCLTIIPKG